MSNNSSQNQKMPMSGAKFLGIVSGMLTIIGLFFGICMWALFMHTEVVEPGHQLVVNDKPYFFGHEGVRPEPIAEGRILLFNTSTVEVVRMTPQSTTIVIDDFSSKKQHSPGLRNHRPMARIELGHAG